MIITQKCQNKTFRQHKIKLKGRGGNTITVEGGHHSATCSTDAEPGHHLRTQYILQCKTDLQIRNPRASPTLFLWCLEDMRFICRGVLGGEVP